MDDDGPRLDYAALFTAPGSVLAAPAAVELVRLPALCVRSGVLVGLDPTNIEFYEEDYAPYERTIAPGLYAGRACVDRDTRSVAVSWLQLRRSPVVRWLRAAPPVDVVAGLELYEPGAPFGYECRGTAALGDAEALAPFVRRPDRLRDAVELALLQRDSPPFAAIPLHAASGANLWVMSVHDGGPVHAFWGLDAGGEAVALVSDCFTGYHGACPPALR